MDAEREMLSLLAAAGGRPFLTGLGIALAALLTALIIILLWRAGAAGGARRRLEGSIDGLRQQVAELSGQLRQQAEAASARDAHIAQLLAERLEALSLHLGQGLQEQTERTGEHLRLLAERLATLEEARAAIRRLSTDVGELQRTLSDKQARGAFGQARMEAIVADALPAELYAFQPELPNGARPDCVVRMPDGESLLVIDAKFPLEAFEALRRAADEGERRKALRRFRRDLLHHVEAIAKKYLLPGVTHDTAILFVPSESVFAAVHEELPEVVQAAHARRVVLASPNTLMLMVQTLQSLLRDARIREAAEAIEREVQLLVREVEELTARAGGLNRHLLRASEAAEDVLRMSEGLARRGRRLRNLDFET
jgi:DNA recombination protein RmuC